MTKSTSKPPRVARLRDGMTAEYFSRLGVKHLPEHLGLEILSVSEAGVESRLAVRPEVMAPNGYLHAAAVVALADTSAGYGCVALLPEGAAGFTTIELKSNFLGTAREGTIFCRATPVHLGRTTQVWDAVVTSEASGARLALFRCTQAVLWPR
ncbi:MAG TPA: PaaI family thioesterase [Burkholderiales bacterium]|nr:PaaI family thioesterase [Burkholderiales bacterium]